MISCPAARWVKTMPSLRYDNLGGKGLAVLLTQLRDTVSFVDPSGRVLLTNRAVATRMPESMDSIDLGAARAVSPGRAAVRKAGAAGDALGPGRRGRP